MFYTIYMFNLGQRRDIDPRREGGGRQQNTHGNDCGLHQWIFYHIFPVPRLFPIAKSRVTQSSCPFASPITPRREVNQPPRRQTANALASPIARISFPQDFRHEVSSFTMGSP